MKLLGLIIAAVFLLLSGLNAPGAIAVEPVTHPGTVDFEKEVLPILNRSCLACHNRTKSKAHLVLETPAEILKGGSSGPAALPGRGADSLLLLAASHSKDDLVMPPADNKVAAPDLTPLQLGLIRLWIDQGAQGEVHDTATIHWQALPRGLDPVYAVALSDDGQFAAVGRGNHVSVYDIPTRRLLNDLADPGLAKDTAYGGDPVAHRDVVNAAAFSPDGRLLATAGYREIKLWRRATDVQRFTIADAAPSRILALATSRDGTRIAIGDADGHIRLFDSSGRPQGECVGHTAAVNAICFAPDGAQLASASVDGTVRVWRASDGAPLAVARGERPANAVAWTGSTTLVSGGDDKLLRVWRFDADSETPLEQTREVSGHEGAITSLAPVPNQSDEVFSGSADGTARLWDLKSGKELRRLSHGGPISAVAVRPDGKRFATAGSNNIARLWDAADGKALAEMRGEHDAQQSVLARQRELATATSLASYHASALQAAQTQHAAELGQLKQAGEAAVGADRALQEKQKALAEATGAKAAADKAVADLNAELKRATDARDAAEKASKESLAAAKAAVVKTDGAVNALEDVAAKAYAAGKAAAALEAATERVRQPLKDAGEKIAAAAKTLGVAQTAFSAAQATQAKAQGNLELAVRLVQQSAEAESAAKESARSAEAGRAKAQTALAAAQKASADAERPIRALAFSADGLCLAVAGDDEIVHTYSAEDGAALDSRRAHRGAVLAIAFSGRDTLLSAGADRALIAWNTEASWSLDRVLGTQDAGSPLSDRVNALAFSPDGRRLASGGGVPSRGGEIRIWQVASGELVASFNEVHSDAVLALAFSPDGRALACGAADRFMKVIDADSGKPIRSFEGHTNHVLGVSWKSNGRTLASAGADNVVKIWDLFTGQRLKTIEGFAKEVTSAHYVSDTNQLLVSCGDGTVRLVSDEGAAIRGLLSGTHFMNCSAVTPDGRIILCGAEEGTVHLWTAPEFREQTLVPRAR